jgi:NADH dehydrogenase/NADH:ubiquinone oxidoreductase subunit G
VGALTLKTYAYKARPWELRSKDTISLKDLFLPPIRIYLMKNQILRILPMMG